MKKNGFTLVEILVVIVIMGILAAVAVPKLFGSIAKAKFSEVPPAAATYMKLQDMYLMAKSEVGNWSSIGYDAPGSNGVTKYFTYTNPGLSAATTSIQDLGEEGKIGWKAVNTKPFRECTAGNQWVIIIIPDEENKIKYEAEVSSEYCLGLASAWGNVNKALVGPEATIGKNIMTTVEVKVGTWDGRGGNSQATSTKRLRITNKENEYGLFEMEPNSTYTFVITAGASENEAEGVIAGKFNIGPLIYEDPTGKDSAVVDMGWVTGNQKEQNAKTPQKDENGKTVTTSKYTTQVAYDKTKNEYTLTIKTGSDVSYFACNLTSNGATEFTEGQKTAITNAAETATLKKTEVGGTTSEVSTGSSSSTTK